MEAQEETEDSEVDVQKTPGNPSLKYIFDDIQRRGASKPKKESPKKKSGSLWQEKKFPPVKRRIVSFKTVTPMKKHPTHPPVEYSFASDYKDQPQVNLILFTTVETKKVHFECNLHLQKTIEYNVANHIRMLSLFQREYSFRGVVFTSFKGHQSTLRHRPTLASCRSGGHRAPATISRRSHEREPHPRQAIESICG